MLASIGRHLPASLCVKLKPDCAGFCTASKSALESLLHDLSKEEYSDQLVDGILSGQRLALSRAITLCESTRPEHVSLAATVLQRLADHKGYQLGQLGTAQPTHTQPRHPSFRIGISGPPGAGKSTLIEAMGSIMLEQGHRVAVLAVDPSSHETGGAILGDKTRMPRLSAHLRAYVRPSPARGTLGGVSRATYDAMQLCEAAGYNRIVVETVGVGQSEVAAANLADCMLLVMPPVGGDDLQMIKRGVMEVADVIAVNKADGETEAAAKRAAREYSVALHLMPQRYMSWQPQALPLSARTGQQVEKGVEALELFFSSMHRSGELEQQRKRKRQQMTKLAMEEAILERMRSDAGTRQLLASLLPDVATGKVAPRNAASQAIDHFLGSARSK